MLVVVLATLSPRACEAPLRLLSLCWLLALDRGDPPPLKWPTLKFGMRAHGGWTYVEEATQA